MVTVASDTVLLELWSLLRSEIASKIVEVLAGIGHLLRQAFQHVCVLNVVRHEIAARVVPFVWIRDSQDKLAVRESLHDFFIHEMERLVHRTIKTWSWQIAPLIVSIASSNEPFPKI